MNFIPVDFVALSIRLLLMFLENNISYVHINFFCCYNFASSQLIMKFLLLLLNTFSDSVDRKESRSPWDNNFLLRIKQDLRSSLFSWKHVF